MSIKFSARGISSAFRTPRELVEQDAVTLKPTVGGEVIVSGVGDTIELASDYTEEGGCTVGEGSYPDTKSLNNAGISVISDVFSAYDCDADEGLNVKMVERWEGYDLTQPLTFENIGDISAVVRFNCNYADGLLELWIKIDDGEWEDVGDTTITKGRTIQPGQKISFKSNMQSTAHNATKYRYFDAASAGSGDIRLKVYGNIMSILYADGFESATSVPAYGLNRTFYNMRSIYDASDLLLPAKTLARNAYSYMLSGIPIEISPRIPTATASTAGAYSFMFRNCPNLKELWFGFNAISSTSSTFSNILSGCPENGILHAIPTAEFVRGSTSIPESWTIVEDYTDDYEV